MTTLTEGRYTGEFLVSEASGARSRDEILITAGKLDPGTVLGRVTTGTATATADSGNTGTGAMGTVTVGASAIPGTYVVEITEAVTSAGKFTVTDPLGNEVGDGNVAVAFTSTHVSFTLADGDPDFAEGDIFTIAVLPSGHYVKLNTGASDGSQTAAAILWGHADASSAPVRAVGITRDAEVNLAELAWPTGFTVTQIATAVGQLEQRGIVARDSY